MFVDRGTEIWWKFAIQRATGCNKYSYRHGRCCPASKDERQRVVQRINVLAESVEQTADGRRVEKSHGKAQHAGDETRVQHFGRTQRHQRQHDRGDHHRQSCPFKATFKKNIDHDINEKLTTKDVTATQSTQGSFLQQQRQQQQIWTCYY